MDKDEEMGISPALRKILGDKKVVEIIETKAVMETRLTNSTSITFSKGTPREEQEQEPEEFEKVDYGDETKLCQLRLRYDRVNWEYKVSIPSLPDITYWVRRSDYLLLEEKLVKMAEYIDYLERNQSSERIEVMDGN